MAAGKVNESSGAGLSPDPTLDDEDEHDGWAPVRPRRSSLPAPLCAEPHEEPGDDGPPATRT